VIPQHLHDEIACEHGDRNFGDDVDWRVPRNRSYDEKQRHEYRRAFIRDAATLKLTG
jgi:hypothetical protein